VREFGLYSQLYKLFIPSNVYEKYLYQAHLHHPISYQGGGDYRGIYDTGLKRGFMGYIGLLLKDPYKIDRMMGCVCGCISVSVLILKTLLCELGLYEPRDKKKGKSRKMWVSKVLGCKPSFRHFEGMWLV
jgi:hypothetical protein